MKLYIQIKNNQPVNHPAFEDNLIQALGAVPAHWEPFNRVEHPVRGVYQILESDEPVYAKVGGVWTDVWSVRELTTEEKTAKQQITKDAWAVRPNATNFLAWILDEATNTMIPPIPRPTQGKHFWQGTTISWQILPERPDDGKNYKFNFITGAWDKEVI